jgi:putative acyl-CoA dehydrogenase
VDDEVLTQPPPLAGYNLFSSDRPLREAVAREGAVWAWAQLDAFGGTLGNAEVIQWGTLANEYAPVLHTRDRFGRRRDEVEFHPAWHNLMPLAVEQDIHNLPWTSRLPGGHVARAALAVLAAENEAGHMWPISMTHSAVPVLRQNEAIANEWMPRIYSTRYDPSFREPSCKQGALVGMAMIEKQGGSDMRANITRAEPLGGSKFALYGHKCALCPGPTTSEFGKVAGVPDEIVVNVVAADHVARVGLRALAEGEHSVVSGLTNWIGVEVQRIAPRRFVTSAPEMLLRPPHRE